MNFVQGQLLHLLWFVPVVGFLLFKAVSRRKKIMGRFVETKLIKDVALGFDVSRWRWKNILLLAVIVFSILALSRPRWGFEWEEVKRKGIDILVVVDVSKSMLTQDVKPNRLERTKLAVKDLLRKLKGDRIGLMAFAGDAFLLCPLTVDYNGFMLSLNDLAPDIIPVGGTNIAKAVTEAMKGYDKTSNQYKAIIVVTDGDNLEGEPLKVAQKAKEEGIKIYTVGIGTQEGELIQIGNGEFLKDEQGNYVKSRLNEKLLQQIALTTGGAYVKAGGAQFGLDLIYERELAKLEKRDIESKREKKYYERFQIPLALALLLLVGETCLGARRDERSKKTRSKK